MLYVVATPIGNLGDITYRAVEVLKSVGRIACEDTRKTRILCERYGIRTPLTSYYEYNKLVKGDYLIRCLKEGQDVALVSDAGTPGISDPGYTLIRSALSAGIKIVSIPGPSALIAALAISGFPANRFSFEGFLPAKSSGRRKKLAEFKNRSQETIVFYESPHRLLKTLLDMREVLGNCRLCLAREVTKKFEEVISADLDHAIQRFTASKPKGEFVVIFQSP